MRGAQYCSFSIFSSLLPLKPSFAPFNFSVYNPIKTLRPVRAQKLLPARPGPWLADASPPLHPEEGPIELPSSDSSIFASSDDPTPIKIATSLLLTGAISVLLFRSFRRRMKRAKELRLRSSGVKKQSELDAIESLKEITLTPTDAKDPPPSPVQALFGGLTAGVIALILYKFTTIIESSLNRQALSDNFSVRQMTITIRTIVNGLFYLATCVFGVNSIGLFLYSGQLALNLLSGGSTPSQETENKRETQLSSDPVDRSGRDINKDDID